VLQEHWWSGLPWRSDAAARLAASGDSAPQEFALGDFDLDSVAKDHKKLAETIAKLEDARESPDSPPILGKDFLSRFHFTQSADGGYAMTYNPPPPDPGLLDRPKKMIDFTLMYSGVIENGVWQGIEDGIGDLVGLIPVPVLEALISTIVGRLLHAHDLMNGMHLAMLNEAVRFAEVLPSTFSELSDDELTFAGGWLVLTGEDLWKVPFDLLKNPEKVWRSQVNGDQKQAGKASAWLTKNGYAPVTIAPDFDEAFHKDVHFLYSMPVKAHWLSDEPHVALRYDRVDQTEAARKTEELLSAAMSYVTHFIPVVGGTLDDIYGWIVEDPTDSDKTWESRLKITLLEDPMMTQRDWSLELRDLDRQKVDFLELDVPAAAKLVELRKQQLGM
jgi:hypothetical protein